MRVIVIGVIVFLIKLGSLLLLDPLSLLFLVQLLLLRQFAVAELTGGCLLLALLCRQGLGLLVSLRRLSDLLLFILAFAFIFLEVAISLLLLLQSSTFDHKLPEQFRGVNDLLHCLGVLRVLRGHFVLGDRLTLNQLNLVVLVVFDSFLLRAVILWLQLLLLHLLLELLSLPFLLALRQALLVARYLAIRLRRVKLRRLLVNRLALTDSSLCACLLDE